MVVAVLLLAGVGLAMIYSATARADGGGSLTLFWRQVGWLVLGLVAMIAAMLTPPKALYAFAYVVYGLAIAALVGVALYGTRVGGAKAWLVVGSLRVQPSEFAKIAFILAMARYLTDLRGALRRPRDLAAPFALTAIPLGLVALQPDLGTAAVFATVLLPMLYWSGLSPLHIYLIVSPLLSIVFAAPFLPFTWLWWGLLGVVLPVLLYSRLVDVRTTVLCFIVNLAAGIASPTIWAQIRPYQISRILAFLNPGHDPLGAGYHIIQTKVAVGSGGVWGKGFLEGTQTGLAFLPEQHTDFIFSVIGEELGFTGALLVLTVYFIFAAIGIRASATAKNHFAGFVGIGLVAIIIFHVFVNVGVSVGLMPVTGLPLPLISYGGSSLVATMLAVGLLVGIALRKHEY